MQNTKLIPLSPRLTSRPCNIYLSDNRMPSSVESMFKASRARGTHHGPGLKHRSGPEIHYFAPNVARNVFLGHSCGVVGVMAAPEEITESVSLCWDYRQSCIQQCIVVCALHSKLM